MIVTQYSSEVRSSTGRTPSVPNSGRPFTAVTVHAFAPGVAMSIRLRTLSRTDSSTADFVVEKVSSEVRGVGVNSAWRSRFPFRKSSRRVTSSAPAG